MTNTPIKPAEVFPPGEFIREELEARGWSQADLAERLGLPLRLISELVAGERAVTPETARGLAQAFESSPELWMNLESSRRLGKSA
jgi:HTH-type transcriptional regulator/antitoxin HigA